MSSPLRHMIIRASAGTGKTHQLVHRYIALLLLQALEGRPRPDQVVAITFTRKGAAEFTQRILETLARAADDPVRLAGLEEKLRLLVRGDPDLGVPGLAPGVPLRCTAATVKAALAAMVDQNDRVVLSTIDSFMARSVQALAFELGIGGFEILEQGAQERQRDELLQRVFDSVTKDDLETFYQTLKQATLRSKVSLRQAMTAVLDDYLSLLFSLPAASAWGGGEFWEERPRAPSHADWRERAAALATALRDEPLSDKSVAKNLASALAWLAARNPGTSASGPPSWLKDGGQLHGLRAAWPSDGWDCYPRSNARKPCRVPAAIMGPFGAIVDSWIAAERAALAARAGAIHRFVSTYEEAYDRHARSQGRLAFSDLPWLLNPRREGAAAERARQMLGFRWDQRFGHWLLDEFQDTSRVQWDVLRPWVDEAIQDDSGQKSVFVVGDAKQSIYGWRGGEPRLMDELLEDYPGAFSEQVMTRSYRSPEAVLALVNAVCDPGCNKSLGGDPVLGARLERWDFKPHEPASPRAGDPGYAAVLLVSGEAQADGPVGEEEEEGASPSRLAAQARAIADILKKADPIGRGLSCAILVRKGDSARDLAEWLRGHGVPGIMVEGDVTLADQVPVVAAIVDALRWLANPAHTQAEGHARLTPLWPALMAGMEPGAAWAHWRRRVAKEGATRVTREWCAILTREHPDPFIRYGLAQVDQLASEVGARSLADWIASVEGLTVRETAAPGVVHLMTIHKAKGLGFGVVILPDLDLGTRNRDDVLVRRDKRGRLVACLPAPSGDICAWMPDLARVRESQRADAALENLCVLYVALTRAEEATFVIMNDRKPRGSAALRDWLMGGVGPADAAAVPPASPWGTARVLWERGRRDFSDRLGPAGERAPEAPVPTLAAPTARRRLRRPSDAGHAAPGSPAASSSREALDFGTEVHRIFETIEWWDGSAALAGEPRAAEMVRACLDVPELRALFVREGAADEVLRELPFESWEGVDAGWTGVMDRVVLRRGPEGSVLRAVVVDFKTDQVAEVETLRERYAAQVRIYMAALASALGLEPRQVEGFLVSTRLRASCRVTAEGNAATARDPGSSG